MRVSVNKDDPGHATLQYGRFDVFLNGELVKGCITADEELGMCEVIDYDDKGRATVEDGRLKTVVRYGKVQLRPAGAKKR